jgi:hypothetical protein
MDKVRLSMDQPDSGARLPSVTPRLGEAINGLRSAETPRLSLDRVVEIARRQLPLDVVYVAEFRGGRQIYRAVAGDAASFNIVLGQGPALLEDTYCQRLDE